MPSHYYPFFGQLMLIAHDEPLNGELRFAAKYSSGHSSAIFACQRAARRFNISHVFYPLISTDMFNMDYVVPPMYRYDMPIINLHVSSHSKTDSLPSS